MSDRPIEVGDLVVVVRGHECVVSALGGIPFVVDAVRAADERFTCSRCGADPAADAQPYAKFRGIMFCGVPIAWLKRIPPLAELETTHETDSIVV